MSLLNTETRDAEAYKPDEEITTVVSCGAMTNVILKQYYFAQFDPLNAKAQATRNRSVDKMVGVGTSNGKTLLFNFMDQNVTTWKYDYCAIKNIKLAVRLDLDKFKPTGSNVVYNTPEFHMMTELHIGPWLESNKDSVSLLDIADKINMDEPGIPSTYVQSRDMYELNSHVIMTWEDFETRVNRKNSKTMTNKFKHIKDMTQYYAKFQPTFGMKFNGVTYTSSAYLTGKLYYKFEVDVGFYTNNGDEMC